MDESEALFAAVRQADAAIAAAAAIHEGAIATDAKLVVRRTIVADGWGLAWKNDVLRSLWLVSHPGLRRGGIRKHPASRAVLLGWRGIGLVQLRGEGARRTYSLVPLDRAVDAESVHLVEIAADMPYDTMADMGTWHVLVAHTHAGGDLVRDVPVEEGWRRLPEAT